MNQRKIGIVEDIEFTRGGFGNQYTTINGTRYITYWDFSEGVKVGATVEFSERPEPNVTFGNVTLMGVRASHFKVLIPASDSKST